MVGPVAGRVGVDGDDVRAVVLDLHPAAVEDVDGAHVLVPEGEVVLGHPVRADPAADLVALVAGDRDDPVDGVRVVDAPAAARDPAALDLVLEPGDRGDLGAQRVLVGRPDRRREHHLLERRLEDARAWRRTPWPGRARSRRPRRTPPSRSGARPARARPARARAARRWRRDGRVSCVTSTKVAGKCENVSCDVFEVGADQGSAAGGGAPALRRARLRGGQRHRDRRRGRRHRAHVLPALRDQGRGAVRRRGRGLRLVPERRCTTGRRTRTWSGRCWCRSGRRRPTRS